MGNNTGHTFSDTVRIVGKDLKQHPGSRLEEISGRVNFSVATVRNAVALLNPDRKWSKAAGSTQPHYVYSLRARAEANAAREAGAA